MRRAGWITLLCAGLPMVTGGAERDLFRAEVSGDVEEVFVFRTLRMSRTAGETEPCKGTPFPAAAEDVYDLWSMTARSADGRLDNTHKARVGEFRACFSALARDQPLLMQATGKVGAISWQGSGACQLLPAQPPVKTVLAFSCTLTLSDLPQGYAGGLVVSSTLAPALGRDADPRAHVPGYLSTSVIIMRLWKTPR